jgi:hypothetical protein
MEKDQITQYLSKVANDLGMKILAAPAYGWHYKSIGSKVSDGSGTSRWLRVLAEKKNETNDRIWLGVKSAGQIHGVNKPGWYGDYEWEDGEYHCRADILEFVSDRPISSSPELHSQIQLEEDWLAHLRNALEHLHVVKTDRIAVRQDLVTRRLREIFGDTVDAEITEWETSHGDLHWANLTKPQFWLLDWEAWGIAPKAFDAALLYCFTLQQPEIAKLIYNRFRDWLDTPSGRKAQMFACAELMRMTKLYSDHPQLYPFLEQHAKRLIAHHNTF